MVAPDWNSFQRPQQQQNNVQIGNQIEQNLSHEDQQEIHGQVVDEMKPEGKQPQWGDFLSPMTFQGNVDPTADKDLMDYSLRNATANASRIGEQVAGKLGNTERFAKDILSNYPLAGGPISWAISELMGPETWQKYIKADEQMLPTSENLEEFSHKITGGYTKPKTPGEAKFQEFSKDVGSLIGHKTPMTHRNPLVQKAINKVLVPAAANVTKNVVEDLGFGKDKANMIKQAVWIPMSLLSNVNAPKYASELMNKGRNGLPANLSADTQRFTHRLDQIEATLSNADPRTALARSTLNNLRKDIANGQLDSRSMMNAYDGVNAAKRDAGLFSMKKSDQKFARGAINRVLGAVRDEIVDMGVNHPEAISNWQNGLGAWSAIHESNAISNYVESLAKGPYAKVLTGPALALFGGSGYGLAQLPAFASLGGTAATSGLYQSGKVINRMWNSPVLAKYYWNAIGAAMNENAQAFITNYNKLNKGLEKLSVMEPSNKSEKKQAVQKAEYANTHL